MKNKLTRKTREQLIRKWIAEGLTQTEIVEALNNYEFLSSRRSRPKAFGESGDSDDSVLDGLR